MSSSEGRINYWQSKTWFHLRFDKGYGRFHGILFFGTCYGVTRKVFATDKKFLSKESCITGSVLAKKCLSVIVKDVKTFLVLIL